MFDLSEKFIYTDFKSKFIEYIKAIIISILYILRVRYIRPPDISNPIN